MNSTHSAGDQFGRTLLAMFKNTTDAILLVQDQGLDGNPAACTLLGYAASELTTLTLADLFDMADPQVSSFFQRLRDSGHASGDFPVSRKERLPVLANADGTAFTCPAGGQYLTLLIRKAGAGSGLAHQRQHGEVGLRAVIETLPDMFWLKDTAGAYLMCNQEFEKYSGIREADLIGRTDYDFTDHAIADGWREHDAAALLAGGPIAVEERVNYKSDGHSAMMLITKTPMRGTDGEVVGVLGIARDITAIKHHESLLEANNKTLAMIARGASLEETLDLVVRNVETQNPDMLCTLMLLDRDQKHLRFGAGPSLPAKYRQHIDGAEIGKSAGSCGTAASIGKAVFVDDIETNPLWAGTRAVALENGLRACWSTPIHSASGVLLGTFAVYYRSPQAAAPEDMKLVDMATAIAAIAIESNTAANQRREVADQLRDHQTRLALALEGSETGVWDRDLQTRVVNYSAGWKALFGFAPEDQSTTSGGEVGQLHPDDLPNVKAQFQAHLQGKTDNYAAEHRVRCKDGSFKWVISRGRIVDRDARGTPLRVIGTTTDINDMKVLAEELRQGRDLITNLTNEVPGVVYQYRLMPDGRSYFPYASEGLRTIYEIAPEDVAEDGTSVYSTVHYEDRKRFAATLRESAEQLTPWHLEYRVVLPKSGLGWRLANAQPRKLADGSILWHGFITDITERKILEKIVLESEEKYRVLTENSPDAIVRYDLQLRRIYVNKVYERLCGAAASDIVGHNVSEGSFIGQMALGPLVDTLNRVLADGHEHELEMAFDLDRQHVIFHTRAVPEFDSGGKVKGVITFSRDITEHKRLEAELQQLATTDFLTGLPNRRYFVARLEDELARIQRLKVPRTSILLIDIDHFKFVNDTFGHATGDLVLKNFARIARGALRKVDTVGRIGGEEFAFILAGADVRDAQVFAERFRKKVEASSLDREGGTISITISIGISAINPADASADAILSRADKALYQAKSDGRNRVEIGTE